MKLRTDGAKRQVLVFMLAPPLPAVAGGDIYAVNALLPFSEQFDYHLFCYVGGESDLEKVDSNRDAYERVFRSVHLEPRPEMPFQMNRFRCAVSLMAQVLRGMPFIDASYYSHSAISSARRIIRRFDIDAFEVNSAHLAFFKKFFPRIPAILIGHNIESDIFPFWMPEGLSGWKRHFMEWVACNSRRAARQVEIENSLGFEAMTFISAADMARVTSSVPKFLMPLFFKKSPLRFQEKPFRPFNVLWMGGFGWYPNAEGIAWFVREVVPLIRDHLDDHDIVLHFCGNHPPEELKAIHDGERIFVHGFVEDIDSMLEQAHLLMVPLKSGAGIRVKIIEAMSAGVPVLSTTKGCEGIAVTDGLDIMVRDDPVEFAAALLDSSQNAVRQQAISDAGLRLVSEYYSENASLTAKREAYKIVGLV